MIKLKDLIVEETKPAYEYGCVMLYFNPVKDFVAYQNTIKQEDLYIADDNGGYGIETEPHCTLLYGLHEGVKVTDVSQILSEITFGDCVIHNPSLFENEKFDVLKFDVTYQPAPYYNGLDFLHIANEKLNKLPNTQTYPDYHPHMTVAYLKPGLGKKYVAELKKGISAFGVRSTHIIYSQADGTKTEIGIQKSKI